MAPRLPFDPQRPWLALSPAGQRLAGGVLALSNFMVVLDLTIANVSVAHIAGDVGVTFDQGAWIITSYAVAEAICVPLTGWLAQRFGTVRVFLLAMMGFAFFSLLCGFSQTLGMIVVSRIGQGLCGGPIMPMSQTLLVRVFPPEKRAVAMAIWAMTVTLGPAMGPILGGWISDNLSWHWIFFINIPIGIAASFSGYMLLRPVETKALKLPIDKVGLGLLVLWIGALQVLLDIGRDHDWFADLRMVGLAVVACVGFCAFIIWELTEEHPVVDLRVFRHRAFSTVLVTQALCFSAFFASIVVVPQWLQVTLGYSATQAGTITALSAFAAVMSARFVAQAMSKVDPRAIISFGCVWMAGTAVVRSFWTSGPDMMTLALPTFALGVGMPCMMIPLTTMALSAVDLDEAASAAGLQNFVRTMAIAVSTSLVLTVWNNSTINARAMLAGRINPELVQGTLTQLGLGAEQSRAYISALVDKEAITIALDHTFVVAAVVLLIAAAIVWFTPRIAMTRLDGPPGGH